MMPQRERFLGRRAQLTRVMSARRLPALVGALALLLLAAGDPLGAQQAGLPGTWVVEFVQGVINENGVETVQKGHARVTIEQRGDSVVAQWATMEPGPDGKVPPARTMRGVVRDGRGVLTTQVQAHVVINGQESTVPLSITYLLTAEGDTLTGTQTADSPEGGQSPPRPVTGRREKPGKDI